jgi:ABC-2 type transport system ATP-binding protein
MDFLIELDGITRTFGTFTALKGVSLRLPPGRVGLLGPNGAGKSTLLKILMGLIPPSSGTGRVLDQPLGGDRDSQANWQLRRLIGFMPEAEALVPGLTGIEYVGLAGELYGMSRRQAARRAHEVLTYLGLEEARYRKVEEYSAGMKQRVKLAQALVHDPPVLLLDEPTSGLDPAGRDALLKLVRELGTEHGKSVILSTHLLADVQATCERVVILAGGVIRGEGTVEELCARRADRFRLQVQGNAGRFRDDLVNEGVTLLADNGHGDLRVAVPAGWSNLAFFKLAEVNDVVVRALVRDDETLEELFLRTVSDEPARTAG